MEGEKERFELLTIRLYNAALKGDVPSLLNLVQLDPHILDQCCIEKSGRFTQSPLHIATDLGHFDFVTKILQLKPRLAEKLDDTYQSPLHLSASNGHLNIVKALLAVNPNMCLARDQDGRNPIHVATVKGQLHVLEELRLAKPQAVYERTDTSETVLHLCVKYNQPDALKHLIRVMDDAELLNAKDSVGNTVLHLAVKAKQPKMVKLLLAEKKLEKNAINANNLTSMDMICEKQRKDLSDHKILECLEFAGALPAKTVKKQQQRDPRKWSEKHHDAVMVVASLIATLAFQVGISPPGGTWQDFQNYDGYHYSKGIIYGLPGTSIYADINPYAYKCMAISNGIALVSSLSVILFILTRFRYNQYFPIMLVILMWIALSATTYTYLIATFFVSHKEYRVKPHTNWIILHDTWQWAALAWALFLACLLIDQTIGIINVAARLIAKLLCCKFGTNHHR